MSIFQRLKKSKPEATPATTPAPTAAVPNKSVQASTPASGAKSTITLAKDILLKPVVTEKSSMSGTYQFMVAPSANRVEVAKAFATLYSKVPRKVNIMKVNGKTVRFGSNTGKRASWKKAVVYLRKGETIDLYTE